MIIYHSINEVLLTLSVWLHCGHHCSSRPVVMLYYADSGTLQRVVKPTFAQVE